MFSGRVGRRRKQFGACPYRNGVARGLGGGIFTGGVQVLPSSENGESDVDRPRREYRRKFGEKIEEQAEGEREVRGKNRRRKGGKWGDTVYRYLYIHACTVHVYVVEEEPQVCNP